MINRPAATVAVSLASIGSLALGGCAAVTAGTALPTDSPALTSPESLPAVLLPAAEVGAAIGGDRLVVTREVGQPWDDSAHFPAGTAAGCLAIAGAAQQKAYAGSGWTSLLGQVLREPPAAPSWSHFATQAVVLFGTAQAAADFFTQSRLSWAGCADRELAYAAQLAPDQVWSVGPVVAADGVLTVSRAQRAPQQWFCQRGLTVRGNAAVDVEACSLDGPSDAAAAMIRAIGDRLPTA